MASRRRSAWTRQLNADGYADPELTAAGRAQADAVADRLAAERIDAIYVSPLRRTAETAAPLAARLELDAARRS